MSAKNLFKKKYVTLVAIVLPVIFSVSTSIAWAQDASAPKLPRQIVVTATGIATAEPDLATLRLGVVSRADSVQKASELNNASMTKLLAKLTDEGIAKTDIQTFDLSIDSIEPSDDNRKADKKESILYQIENTVSVKIRDLAKLGKTYDDAVSVGVNESNGLIFSNANSAPYQAMARKYAIAEAIEKAKTIADAANVKLGPILSIVEDDGKHTPLQVHSGFVGSAMSNTPIAGGELAYDVTVTITYAIE